MDQWYFTPGRRYRLVVKRAAIARPEIISPAHYLGPGQNEHYGRWEMKDGPHVLLWSWIIVREEEDGPEGE